MCYSYRWWLLAIIIQLWTCRYTTVKSTLESQIPIKLISTICFWCLVCVLVMKQPFSEEWHIAVGPWFIVDAYFEYIAEIYCHTLNGNKLVQFGDFLQNFLRLACASRPQNVDPYASYKSRSISWNKCRMIILTITLSYMKHMSDRLLHTNWVLKFWIPRSR
jgi:hypothetical protein